MRKLAGNVLMVLGFFAMILFILTGSNIAGENSSYLAGEQQSWRVLDIVKDEDNLNLSVMGKKVDLPF